VQQAVDRSRQSYIWFWDPRTGKVHATSDDVYGEPFIPKGWKSYELRSPLTYLWFRGTVVMVNQWYATMWCIQLLELNKIVRARVSRDESIFPNASRFDPSRHLTGYGQPKDCVTSHVAFGNGRWIPYIPDCSLTRAGVFVQVGWLRVRSVMLCMTRALESLTGRWFVENALWTAMTAILAVLRIDHARDPKGNRVEIQIFTTGTAV